MDVTRVVICDDHAVVRAGLRLILEAQPGFALVGEAADGAQVLALARQVQPDVVMLDLSLPGGSGLAVIPALRQAVPDVKVLVLTVHEDEAYFFAALQAGAAGYLLKGESSGELLAALDLVVQGGVPIPRRLGQRLAAEHLGRTTDDAALSDREQELLRLIAAGCSNKEIAETLFLSLRTVERHRSTIMSKLGFQNKVELLRYAVQRGLLDSPDPEALP
jgi:two-component system response regulator NreC